MVVFERLKEMILNFIHTKLEDSHTRDHIISYCSGHILTTAFILGTLSETIILSSLKIVLALIVGIIGGIGGLLGKDIYEWGKKKIKVKKHRK